MYYCKNCGKEFHEPEKVYETHKFSNAPFEIYYVCPACKSKSFRERNQTHCHCCGGKLTKGQSEYCSESCKNKGEKLWRRELNRRKNQMLDPLNLIVKECNDYNKEHGTRYSYGQYVAIIRPKLLKEKQKCGKKRKNT